MPHSIATPTLTIHIFPKRNIQKFFFFFLEKKINAKVKELEKDGKIELLNIHEIVPSYMTRSVCDLECEPNFLSFYNCVRPTVQLGWISMIGWWIHTIHFQLSIHD